MKKEYLILAVVILALSVYLVVKKDNLQNYTLPEPMKIEQGEINKILITRKNITVELVRKNEIWVMSDKKFTADMTKINELLDVIRNLKVSGLISESTDTIRYELDEPQAIDVKVFKDKEPLLSFKIGKTAPSGNHTFIMLAGDTKIYQADKNFQTKFNTSVDTLRDKQVLTFKQAAIEQISLVKDGVTKNLTRAPAPASASASASAKDDKETDVSWKFEDGTTPDKEALTNLLSSLSFLKCERFSDSLSKEELEKLSPLCKITIKDTPPIVLNIFDKKDGDSMVATSSMTPYPFVLESYKGKDILSYVDQLAGLVKEEIKIDKE